MRKFSLAVALAAALSQGCTERTAQPLPPDHSGTTMPAAPSLAAVPPSAEALLPVQSPSTPEKSSVPIGVRRQMLSLMDTTAKPPKVSERSRRMITYESVDIEGWIFSLTALRTPSKARWLQLSAPKGALINSQDLGRATLLCDLRPGAASQQVSELEEQPGTFILRVVLPDETGAAFVNIYSLAYIKDAAPMESDPEVRKCLLEKHRLK